jgi:hypothetical protein
LIFLKPVPQRRLEEALLIALVDLILIGELQDGRGADGDLVAVDQLVALDLGSVAERAVGRSEVDEQVLAAVALDGRVLARNAVIEHANGRSVGAADHRSVPLQPVHLSEARPRDHQQVGARAARRCGRLHRWLTLERGVVDGLRHLATMLTDGKRWTRPAIFRTRPE